VVAALHGQIDVLNTLIVCAANVGASDKRQQSPLFEAAMYELLKAIEVCIQHANDQSFTVSDKRGRSFWHLLFLFGSRSEIAFAANIPATVFASDAKYRRDDLIRTPLHYACMKRNTWILTVGWRPLAKEFVQEFSDSHINKQDSFGRTALHYAAMTGSTKLIDFLKTRKADDTVGDMIRLEITFNILSMITEICVTIIRETFLACD